MSYTSATLIQLEKEHQDALNIIQGKMLIELKEAQVSGNNDKLNEASIEFENTAIELSVKYKTRIKVIHILNH